MIVRSWAIWIAVCFSTVAQVPSITTLFTSNNGWKSDFASCLAWHDLLFNLGYSQTQLWLGLDGDRRIGSWRISPPSVGLVCPLPGLEVQSRNCARHHRCGRNCWCLGCSFRCC